ncbi:uncharacterized protein LOC131845209 [Achroia grisella]|uniref:uncharacterized protein LOC131845209 n=1 Tax=Achroia grisella TaxID=688607 RepID=UPI0027D1EE33|nr:uncharacterized protein LOC131845209 [Achroia grisella]
MHRRGRLQRNLFLAAKFSSAMKARDGAPRHHRTVGRRTKWVREGRRTKSVREGRSTEWVREGRSDERVRSQADSQQECVDRWRHRDRTKRQRAGIPSVPRSLSAYPDTEFDSELTASSLSLYSELEAALSVETPKHGQRTRKRATPVNAKTDSDDGSDVSAKKPAARPVFRRPSQEEELRHAEDLGKQVDVEAHQILEAVRRSGNLKGSVIREIKDAVASIRRASDVLVTRSATAECARLRAANSRLEKEVFDLKEMMAGFRVEFAQMDKEMAELRGLKKRGVTPGPDPTEVARLKQENAELEAQLDRYVKDNVELRQKVLAGNVALRKAQRSASQNSAEPSPAPAPPIPEKMEVTSCDPPVLLTPSDDMEGRIVRQIGEMFNARFAKLEEALPQKGKKKEKKKTPPKQDVQKTVQPPPKTPAARAAANKKEATDRPGPVAKMSPGLSQQPSTSTAEEGWSTVVRRGKKSSAATKTQKAPAAQAAPTREATKESAKPKKRRLRPPRSSAIVLTIQPEAEKGGLTYSSVLREAKDKISLAELGITELKFKPAITGARILEVPGDSGDKADQLANKLASILPEGSVRVSRPMKSAELRIGDLDDSATAAEVVAAVAREGKCTVETVKSGEIRRTSSGVGTLWVRCPVAAAKALVDAGRVKIGWTMARVFSLDPRPLRCYRCLLTGHVGQRCTAREDCGGMCFRCGQAGHKAASCVAPKPHCRYCAAAGRDADHRIGSGKQCRAPKARAPAPASGSGGEDGHVVHPIQPGPQSGGWVGPSKAP